MLEYFYLTALRFHSKMRVLKLFVVRRNSGCEYHAGICSWNFTIKIILKAYHSRMVHYDWASVIFIKKDVAILVEYSKTYHQIFQLTVIFIFA